MTHRSLLLGSLVALLACSGCVSEADAPADEEVEATESAEAPLNGGGCSTTQSVGFSASTNQVKASFNIRCSPAQRVQYAVCIDVYINGWSSISCTGWTTNTVSNVWTSKAVNAAYGNKLYRGRLMTWTAATGSRTTVTSSVRTPA